MGVIRRYITDPEDAEDILHDGFIVAFTRISTLRDPDRLEYWLATIMKNLSLQYLQQQDVAEILHDIPEMEDTDDVPPIEEIIGMDVLEQLIGRLPDGYQKVFRLTVLENKTHKEIGKMLGIAPHTSSSQLYHAKVMLRGMIRDYKPQAGLVCLLLLGGAALWLQTGSLRDIRHSQREAVNIPGNGGSDTKVTGSDPHRTLAEASANNREMSVAGKNPSVPSMVVADDPESPERYMDVENIAESSSGPGSYPEMETVGATDLSENILETYALEGNAQVPRRHAENIDSLFYAQSMAYYTSEDVAFRNPEQSNGWSIGAGVGLGVAGFDFTGYKSDVFMDPGSSSSGPNGPDDGDDEDGVDNCGNENKDDHMNDGQTIGGIPINRHSPARTNENIRKMMFSEGNRHHDLPVEVGITMQKSLTQKLFLQTGLTYTYLHSTYEASDVYADCRWHYLGVPLKLKFDFLKVSGLAFYEAVGGSIEIPIHSVSESHFSESSGVYFPSGRLGAKVQWSATLGLGLSFDISRRVSVFVEPTLNYHFGPGSEAKNYWCDNPWGFSVPIGFRFNF